MPNFLKPKKRKCLDCEGELTDQEKGPFCKTCQNKAPEKNIDDNGETCYLPDDLLETNIFANLEEGRVVYSVPWAMFADVDKRLYIVRTYTFHERPGGTVKMRVMVKNGEIFVDKSSIRGERYSPKNPTYTGCSEDDFVPIKLVNHF